MRWIRFSLLAALLMSVSPAPAQAQLLGTDATTDSQRNSDPVESRTDTIGDPGAEINFGDGDAFSWMVQGDSINFHPRTGSLSAPWGVTIELSANHDFVEGELLTLVFALDPTLDITNAFISRAVTVDRVSGSVDANMLTVVLRNMVEVSQNDFAGQVQIAFNVEVDTDDDGFADDLDNCRYVANPDQADADGNGVGDACQDSDEDGVLDIGDNCPLVANTDQADADGDGTGDACEPDSDADGVIDDIDNCVSVSNSNQLDTDRDGFGDACDADDDGDNVADAADNCPLDPNQNQADLDRDGFGDVCDGDDDNDGVIDGADHCMPTAAGAVVNGDGCSIADLAPCDSPWKNHGAHVSAVARAAEAFVASGWITETEKDATVAAAAESQCGSKN